ncbi:MAG: hypothetical protein AAF206_09665 [Bacteroidota bacterium]
MQTQAFWRTALFSLLMSVPVLSLLAQQTYYPETKLRSDIRLAVVERLKRKAQRQPPALLNLVFKTNQCVKPYEDLAKKYGWPAYQGPTALAFYEIILTEIIQGREFNDPQIREIYEAKKAVYLAERTDADLGNEGLQRKYDPLIMEGLWVATMLKISKKHRPTAEQLARDLLDGKSVSVAAEGLPIESTSPARTSRPESSAPKPTTSPERQKDVSPAASQASVPAPPVEDIILRTVTSYGLSGTYIENEVSVLFKNGEMLTNPTVPLSELDVRESKQSSPKKWAKWERKGNVLEVHKAWKNKTYEWKKWFALRPGKNGKSLSGRFNTSDGFGGASVINASTVQFDRSGRFAWKTIKGGNTSWKPMYSQSETAGTYVVDDYSLHLTYNNGRKESFFFGLYPKDDVHFVIGSRHFTPVE